MYSFDSKIRYSECDGNCKLRPDALMNYFQDASTFHSEDLGVGVNYLVPHNMIWVLVSWQIEIERYPVLGEVVEICTFPYDFKGFFGYRNFFMRTKEGEILARANTLWTLLSFDSMKPVQPPKEMLEKYPVEPKLEMNYSGRKIVVGDNGTMQEPIVVKKQHLDSNHHVNNTQYISMAMDCREGEAEITGLRAEYKVQAHLNDVLRPYVVADGEHTVVSLRNEEDAVYVNVEFTMRGTAGNDLGKEPQ